jgi:hypothetical protein
VVTFAEKANLGNLSSFNGAVHIEPVVEKKHSLSIILNITKEAIYFIYCLYQNPLFFLLPIVLTISEQVPSVFPLLYFFNFNFNYNL